MFKNRKLFKHVRRHKFNDHLFHDNVMMVHKLTSHLTNNADRMEERMNEQVVREKSRRDIQGNTR